MKFSAFALIAFLMCSPPAFAKGITYDCDTAPGHYSELMLPGGSAFEASGKVTLLQMAAHERWAPLVRIAVSNDPGTLGPSREGWAGFKMGNLPQFEDRLPALLETSERERGGDVAETTIAPASSREVAFMFVFDGQTVEMTVDGHIREYEFSAEHPVLKIVCSTGEFLVHDLVISANE